MLWFIIVAPLMNTFSTDHPRIPPCPTKDWIDRELWHPITTFVDAACTSDPMEFENIMKIWDNGLSLWSSSSINKAKNKIEWCTTDYFERAEDAIKTTMKRLDPFLDYQERFISDFMVSGHNRTIEHLCKNGENALTEQVKKNDYEHCDGNNYIGPIAINAIIKCIPKAPFYQEMKNIYDIMNKSDFCSNFRTATKCIIDDIASHCTERGFSTYLNTIFEKHLDWCNKNNTQISGANRGTHGRFLFLFGYVMIVLVYLNNNLL